MITETSFSSTISFCFVSTFSFFTSSLTFDNFFFPSIGYENFKSIQDTINDLTFTEVYKSLEKEGVPLVTPPIKKTNLILKNPNFQVATRLWEFLYAYGMNLNENENKDGLDTAGTSTIKEILDDEENFKKMGYMYTYG